MLRGLFRTKNLDDILAAAGGPQFSLKRTLGAFNVTLIGIGAIIGAGIFATVGTAASGTAERAVTYHRGLARSTVSWRRGAARPPHRRVMGCLAARACVTLRPFHTPARACGGAPSQAKYES